MLWIDVSRFNFRPGTLLPVLACCEKVHPLASFGWVGSGPVFSGGCACSIRRSKFVSAFLRPRPAPGSVPIAQTAAVVGNARPHVRICQHLRFFCYVRACRQAFKSSVGECSRAGLKATSEWRTRCIHVKTIGFAPCRDHVLTSMSSAASPPLSLPLT